VVRGVVGMGEVLGVAETGGREEGREEGRKGVEKVVEKVVRPRMVSEIGCPLA
jgi:hypothetical protein